LVLVVSRGALVDEACGAAVTPVDSLALGFGRFTTGKLAVFVAIDDENFVL